MSTQTQDAITPDLDDLPLDAEDGIDDADYSRTMRRIGVGDDGTDTDVCAFNSSI